jgi:hypothetical protein
MGSRETMIVKLVIWICQVLLRDKWRPYTPEDLQVIVNNYLAEMQNLGIRFVKSDSLKGDTNEQLSSSDPSDKDQPGISV